MTTPIINPVILCGGNGTRLWPLSRKSYPKQFSRLMGDDSLFQSSIKRILAEGYAPPLVVTGDPFRFIVSEQLAGLQTSALATLIEPEGRNTAPAILAAALWLAGQDKDALMLVLPSDHVIPDDAKFREAVATATSRAQEGELITFGITPTQAETGYGWLELLERVNTPANCPQPIKNFVEKPCVVQAQQMFKAGSFLWNAGIFLFTAGAIVEAFGKYAPQMLADVKASVEGAQSDLGFIRLAADPWARVEDISIDYAIMEQAENLSVMPYDGVWSDLGAWHAVWQNSAPDGAGNVTSDQATAIDCRDTLLRSETPGLELVGIGLDDIVAVATNDAVLVARKSDSQRVKEAVIKLKIKKAKQAESGTVDHRPWGWFERLVAGDRFQVKRIVVHPGESLSLQSHHHRSEHWIVVAGTARVTMDDEVRLVAENQSIYVPLGAAHRLENPGKLPMVLIEVQTGSYLGEDDIIRYEDKYARA